MANSDFLLYSELSAQTLFASATQDGASLVSSIEGAGAWAPLVFVLVEIVGVMALQPPMVLTLTAGILFGVVWGSLYVWTGTIIGATLAFLIGRRYGRSRMETYMTKHPRLGVIDAEAAKDGWKFILATRLVPMFPFKASNYIFGGFRFSLKDFCVGTGIGIVPFTLLNVYAGALAARVGSAAVYGTPEGEDGWPVHVLQFLLIAGATLYIAWRAKRMIETTRVSATPHPRPR